MSHHLRHDPVGIQQNPFVVRQAGQQTVRTGTVIDLMPLRKGFGVTLQLVHAEQFRTQRQIVAKLSEQTVNTDPGGETFPTAANCPAQKLHSSDLLFLFFRLKRLSARRPVHGGHV
jgi:hypothetical protein